MPTVLLLGAALIYGVGLVRLRRRIGGRAAPRRRDVLLFFGGIALGWLALQSPIATYSGLFFFLHMTQHLLLVLGVVPMLLLARPILPLLWGLPRPVRLAVGGWISTLVMFAVAGVFLLA